MKKLIVVVMVLLTAGCNNPTAKLDKVKIKMKDPESAQFRNVKYSPDKYNVCGEVNGKNAYGGYVGFRRFCIYLGDDALIEGSGDFKSNAMYSLERDKAHNVILEGVVKRLESGDKNPPSDSEINELSDKLAFDTIYKELCE